MKVFLILDKACEKYMQKPIVKLWEKTKAFVLGGIEMLGDIILFIKNKLGIFLYQQVFCLHEYKLHQDDEHTFNRWLECEKCGRVKDE